MPRGEATLSSDVTMAEAALEMVLRRDRVIVATALAVLAALATSQAIISRTVVAALSVRVLYRKRRR
jgi:hypothetical protein